MAHCIVCHNELPRGAKVCTHCDSYQDWRRYFGVSSTILSLLVALFSVLTVAVPVLRNALTPDISDVRCNLLTWNENSGDVTLVVSNNGRRPAVVKALVLKRKKESAVESKLQFQGPLADERDLANAGPDLADPILEPGKYRTLRFHGVISGSRTSSLDRLNGLRKQYQLVLEIFPFAREPDSAPCENWDRFQ